MRHHSVREVRSPTVPRFPSSPQGLNPLEMRKNAVSQLKIQHARPYVNGRILQVIQLFHQCRHKVSI